MLTFLHVSVLAPLRDLRIAGNGAGVFPRPLMFSGPVMFFPDRSDLSARRPKNSQAAMKDELAAAIELVANDSTGK